MSYNFVYRKPEDDEFKENMAKNENMVIPLSWDDQVQASEAKIMTPRGPPADRASQVFNCYNKLSSH